MTALAVALVGSRLRARVWQRNECAVGGGAKRTPTPSDPASLASFDVKGDEVGAQHASALKANCARSHYAGI